MQPSEFICLRCNKPKNGFICECEGTLELWDKYARKQKRLEEKENLK